MKKIPKTKIEKIAITYNIIIIVIAYIIIAYGPPMIVQLMIDRQVPIEEIMNLILRVYH
ncbi:hypothetical protein SCLARK_001737 [Spiroplasma clarkii]|uniref:hypothetical protein n=1 Tax=Spiroplasma clarkii TaxID=2139 RepID=UPI000B56C3E4|nr:hypothetical protein [Spiroplasma clarkii]ARU92190.1 hypothetical protein SCLARK_001737 [Spiroplasma clarkii]